MKYLAFLLFIFFYTNLGGQIIYTDHQRPFLNIETWQWINSDNKEKELAGKHLILEFWASWCPGGLTTIPNINRLNAIFSEDITFVLVNSYDTRSVIEKLIQEHGIKSYVVRDGDKYLEDLFEIQLIPLTILIDKNGVLRWKGLARQLSAGMLEEFVRNDTIYSILDTIMIDQTFLINDAKQNKQIPVQLKTNRLIRKPYQISASSLDINFDNFPLVDLRNYSIPTIFKLLLANEIEKEVVVFFKGNVPEDIEVNFSATANQKIEKTLFLSETIKAFATALNASIDTMLVQQNVQILKVDSNDLIPFLSADQESDPSGEDQDDQFVFQNLTLKEFSRYISQITKERILIEGDDQQKYNFTIEKIADFFKMKDFLKTAYRIEFQEKKVERNQFEFTFH